MTAYDIRKSLDDIFNDNKDARAMELDQELCTITIGDMSNHAYCQRIKTIADLLANIDQPVPEKTLVTFMVNDLGEKFDQLAGIIRHQNPLPSFFQARSMLVREELRLSRKRPQYGIHQDNSSAPTILYSGNAEPSRTPFTHSRGDCQNQDLQQNNDRR